MSDFISTLARISFSGGIFILAAVLVRSGVRHRLPKHFLVLLWAAVLVHFTVLAGVPSPTSIYNYVSFRSPVPASETAAPAAPPSLAGNIKPAAHDGAASAAEAATVTHSPVSWTVIAGIVWSFGAAALLGVFVIGYWRTVRRFRDAVLLKENPAADAWRLRHAAPVRIVVSDRTATPLAFGIFRPRIVLPRGLDLDDAALVEAILEHEYIHCRHCHNAMKAVATLVLAVHWFNPLVWLFWLLFNHDIELACDEGVIAALGETRRAAYAHSLVAVASRAPVPFPLASAFSVRSLKERIVDIMGYKRTTTPLMLAEGALLAALFAVFGTSPAPAASLAPPQGQPAGAGRAAVATGPRAAGGHDPSSAALAVTGGGRVVKMEMDRGRSGTEYEFAIVRDGALFSVEVEDGFVTEYERRAMEGALARADFSRLIDIEQACSIAMQEYPGALLDSCELKQTRDGFVYEVEFEVGGKEYEVAVDAVTGALATGGRLRRNR